MASTAAWDKEGSGNEATPHGETAPGRATELDPNLALLSLEQLRVSSAQASSEHGDTGPSGSPGKARGEVCPPSGAKVNSEPAERRHSELTSRYSVVSNSLLFPSLDLGGGEGCVA